MEAVLKFGGSLSKDPVKLKKLCIKSSKWAKEKSLTIVPGGGKFADIIRDFDEILNLPALKTHEMAILAMDLYGLLLASLTPNSQPVKSLRKCIKLSRKGVLPIILPYETCIKANFKPSWNVTSDTLSAYIAALLKAEKLILIKDVDGIYDEKGKILKVASLNWLKKNKSCLDKFFPKIIEKVKIESYVVNGFYPDRIEKILLNKETLCTIIKP
ncbi:MAG: hypothetical protein QW487_07790 [Candidatus Bathyarchaeia archaeon]|nr:hypothetical protein [Candidatus Bathyarchaeota archaeon]